MNLPVRRPVPHRRVLGHTLVEVLVGLTISAILAGLALVPLRQFLARRSVEHVASGLGTALRLARAEAMARGEVVTVCPRDPQAQEAAAVCASKGTDWSAGLLIFVDRGRRGVLEPGDLLLRVQQPLLQAPVLRSTLRTISFQPSGISLTAASHFDVVPPGVSPDQLDAVGGRRICINKPGRMRQIPGGQPCDNAG